MHDNRTSSDFGMVTNHNIAQYLRTATNDNSVANRRVALAAILASTSQSHTLVYEHVVANLSRFADHNSHAVVDKETPAYLCPRMNFNASNETAELRNYSRNQWAAQLVQPVRQTVQQDSMDTWITEQDFQAALCSRNAVSICSRIVSNMFL